MPRCPVLSCRLLGVALLLPALAACHRIETSYCRIRLPPSHLVVDAEPIEMRVDHHPDARAIGDAHGQDGESITYGLTTATPLVKSDVRLHVLRIPGGVCARPDVLLHLAYQQVTVQIAHELPEGSCGYNAVLGHEQKHVAVFRQQLQQSVEAMRGEMDAKSLGGAVRYKDAEQAEAAMQALQDSWLVPEAQRQLAEAAARQSDVDTPQEYQRVAGLCPNDALINGASAPDAHRF